MRTGGNTPTTVVLFWGSLALTAWAVYSGSVAVGLASVALAINSFPRQLS